MKNFKKIIKKFILLNYLRIFKEILKNQVNDPVVPDYFNYTRGEFEFVSSYQNLIDPVRDDIDYYKKYNEEYNSSSHYSCYYDTVNEKWHCNKTHVYPYSEYTYIDLMKTLFSKIKWNYISASGSRYIYTKEYLYRYSDHWCEVASCRWYIENRSNHYYDFNLLGRIKWSDLEYIPKEERKPWGIFKHLSEEDKCLISERLPIWWTGRYWNLDEVEYIDVEEAINFLSHQQNLYERDSVKPPMWEESLSQFDWDKYDELYN